MPVRIIGIMFLTCALVGWVAMAPGAAARQPTEANVPTAGVQLPKPAALSPLVLAAHEPSAPTDSGHTPVSTPTNPPPPTPCDGCSPTPTEEPTTLPSLPPKGTPSLPSASPSGTPPPPHGRIQGDADCNGIVNALDALQMLRGAASLGEADCASSANVDCQYGTNVIDALLILRYAAGLPTPIDPAVCPPIGTELTIPTPSLSETLPSSFVR